MKKITTRILAILVFFGLTVALQAQTVMQKLKSNSQTTEFAKALEKANIDDRLDQKGPFTLFAPSNKAFTELSSVESKNSNLLLNHIFTGMATERSLKAMSDVTCLSGRNLKIEHSSNNGLLINSVRIISPNIKADNGVIHIIEDVIK